MSSQGKSSTGHILVTGVTGYVGGRLVPRLLKQGYSVRVLVRGGPERLSGRSWSDQVDIVSGDVLQPDSLVGVMDGVSVAYYLIHSMRGSTEFSQRDKKAAIRTSPIATGNRSGLAAGRHPGNRI
jgi:uncharacterized protein YbjT (DUF2867 family)